MCIQIDDRAGSAQLAPLLRGIGVEVELTRLSYGDAAWIGYGQGGVPMNVGVEIKSVDDILACVISGRYAGHQLPGMLNCYDHVYLLIVGEWRCREADGVLEQRKSGRGGGMYWVEAGGGARRWMWRDLESWLMTMRVMGSVRVVREESYPAAARWLKVAKNWYGRPEHKSHLVLYSGPGIMPDQALLTKPSLVRRLAAELPRIGVERSADVAKHFGSVSEMVNASERDWMQIDGIGKTIAKTIVKAIHGSNGKGH